MGGISMKKNKNGYYSAHLWVDEDGKLHCMSFENQQIPILLFDALNYAVHEVMDRFQGKTSWKEEYIKFTDNGKRYEQFWDVVDEIDRVFNENVPFGRCGGCL